MREEEEEEESSEEEEEQLSPEEQGGLSGLLSQYQYSFYTDPSKTSIQRNGQANSRRVSQREAQMGTDWHTAREAGGHSDGHG